MPNDSGEGNAAGKPSRRKFLRRSLWTLGGLGLGTVALVKGCLPEQLDNPDFEVPSPKSPPMGQGRDFAKEYAAAYAALENSIPEAVKDIVGEAGKFNLGDLDTAFNFDIKIIPPHGRMPGAMTYAITNDAAKRHGMLPRLNQLLGKCVDIVLLDEASRLSGTGKSLDFDKLATKMVHYLQEELFIWDPKRVRNELSKVVRGVVEEAVAFVRKPAPGVAPDASPQRTMDFTIGNKTFHITVMNPLLRENQRQATQMNGGLRDR